jgi:LysM repeat protein
MNEMRYRANLSPNDKFTEKHYNRFLKEDDGNVNAMLKRVKDKDAFIRLMNNFYTPAAVVAGGAAASAENKQYGGIPESLDGLNEYPEQPVIVPAGDITMDGIEYPVDAYDANTGEFLETMQPNKQYKFGTNRVLEIPQAQFGNDGVYFPPNYQVRQGDTLSKIASSYGLTLEDLIKANPNIADVNRISVGDKITIPDVTVRTRPTAQPVDRSAEIAGIEELPEELDVQGEDVIPTLDVEAQTVRPNGSIAPTIDKIKDVVKNTRVGKLNREIPTNTIAALARANRSINLPYRMEVPNRTLNYNELDATPYLDEVDSAVNQQLQYVNQNTSQGQAIANSIFNNALRQKRQVLNQVNAQNLNLRRNTDNANVQMRNQSDLMQERANAQYTQEVYQTLDNMDQRRVQQAQYLDDLEATRIRQDNDIATMNMKYTNFTIDPITGEIYQKPLPKFKGTKKFGFKALNC